VNEIETLREAKRFPHECFPVSLLLENLQIQDGEILAKTAEGFDATRQVRGVKMFLRKLSEFILDREVRSH
jgi:hypothetical protein